MPKVDILFGTILLVSLILGWRQGLVGIAISLIATITATVIIFKKLYVPVTGTFLHPDEPAGYALVLVLVYSACYGLGFLLRKAIEKALEFIWANWINRLAGAAIGLVTGLIICVAAGYYAARFPAEQPILNAENTKTTVIYPVIKSLADRL